MYRNTTDIPDQLVAVALSFIMEDEDMQGIGLPSLIQVKNKRHGKVYGQWGWYYSRGQEIVIIVPRTISHTKRIARKRARQWMYWRNRMDFLVGVLAHEMRHHYQYVKWNTPRGRWRLANDKLGKVARETDAELFEVKTLARWQKFTAQLHGEWCGILEPAASQG